MFVDDFDRDRMPERDRDRYGDRYLFYVFFCPKMIVIFTAWCCASVV